MPRHLVAGRAPSRNSTRAARIVLLGALGVLLQQVSVPYTAHLFGTTEAASLVHLHSGLLLAVAMLERDRVVQAGVVGLVFLGWVVRAVVGGYDMALWLPLGAASYLLGWLWMIRCASWMGWPQPHRSVRVGKRDLARFAGIGLLLCPLGLAAIAWLVEARIGGPEQLSGTVQVLFAKYFGIAVLTFPLVMAWCERYAPRPGALRWQDALLPGVLVAALVMGVLASNESGFVDLRAQAGVVLMDYRFALFALLGWCALRLRPRTSMALLVATQFVLVLSLAATATRTGTPDGFINLAHLAFELGVLLMAMLYFVVFERDSREASQRLVEEALRDTATGLPNLAALRQEITRRPPPRGGEIGFLLLDHADDLVAGYGLDMQSQVMNTVAARLAGINRPYLVGMGQFALLPTDGASPGEAGTDADPWTGAIAAVETIEINSGGQRLALSPYLGVARRVEGSAEAAEAALLRASQLAFEARSRNEVQPLRDEDASSPQSDRLRQRLHAANDALACLRKRHVELYFQPIRPLDPAHPVCAEPDIAVGEVLCRLRGADGRLIMPSDFLGPVEAVGRNVELDLAVLTTLFELLRAHRQALPKIRRLAVNLTGQSLASLGFKRQFEALLADSPLPLSALCFEITENAVISAEAHTLSFLDDLHERGCRMAIDDFGTGMQSFARLKELPVDIIKIDGAFVRHVAQRGRDYALVEASVSIARAFDAETVAEFVEDQVTAGCLRDLGVDWMQGYLHARPQRLDALLATARAATDASVN